MINKTFLLAASLLFCLCLPMAAQPDSCDVNDAPKSIEYFLSEQGHHFNGDIPTPYEALGFNVGEQYADWGEVTDYLKLLDKVSDRVSLKMFGKTYQNRRFMQVYITSEANQVRLQQLREEHLQLTDVDASKSADIKKMPVVVDLMASIHGNEASGVNSILVSAYYFTACEDEEIKELLDNTIIILTPGLNPDGINRFASWVNSSRSENYVSDLNSREFNEPWPSSRTNHYWADCNRDWLSVQHPEGENGVKMFLEWMPNVVLDMHEQGGNAQGFYFSPGDDRRVYSDIPEQNQKLTFAFAENTASVLDRDGIFYYSKEGYDDYFIGKGAAYGDILGSVCILHEQVASRGFLRPTAWGPLSFATTVRNQSIASIGVVLSAYKMKDQLLEYQRDFYVKQRNAANVDNVKGYLFNSMGNRGIEYHFLKNMLAHDIAVYKAKNREGSYIIPLNQNKYYTIKAIWNDITEFSDSTFYDVSTWTLPRAYNLDYTVLKSVAGQMGERVEKVCFPKGGIEGGKSNVAYAFEMEEYYAPYLVSELLKRGVILRVATKHFICQADGQSKTFNYGTIVVPVINQPLNSEALYETVERLSEASGVSVTALKSGFMQNYDLGSPMFKHLREPNVAVVAGRGMGVPDSGEIWYLLDERFNFNHTLIDYSAITESTDLSRYNVIIFANGTPSGMVTPSFYSKINDWVRAGGTLIVTGKAVAISNKAKLTDIVATSGKQIQGVIMNCRIKRSNPLGWGYEKETVPVFKMSSTVYESEQSSVIMSYSADPYLSGCISRANIERIAGTPAVMNTKAGKGNVIFISDDLNFRSYWLATSKIFLNAILFGNL